jgi:hypothetical protein
MLSHFGRNFKELSLGHVIPTALVVAQSPKRRKLRLACQGQEFALNYFRSNT